MKQDLRVNEVDGKKVVLCLTEIGILMRLIIIWNQGVELIDNIFMITYRTKDNLGDFDFSRADKFYSLRIPAYFISESVVFYEIHLKDLTNCETYITRYRFKELKNVYELLNDYGVYLPIYSLTFLPSPKLTSGRRPITTRRWLRREGRGLRTFSPMS